MPRPLQGRTHLTTQQKPTERLRLEEVRKSFRGAAGEVAVLQQVNLSLNAGEFGIITGPSGSGKTTLLMLAGLLQPPDHGSVWFDGQNGSAMTERQRTETRKYGVGMVFQKFCLMPHRSVLDNVLFRFRYLKHDPRAALSLSTAALERVGLSAKSRQAARLLSAGEMQRVAIARALALPPRLLLADEPTGNLDPDSAARVMQLFREFNRAGMSILLVTHNPEWITATTPHWTMHDGRLSKT